ncbi:MAG: hypothetical protein JRD69_08800 [Deltaproteobacteria bacterium]|nr:hypothetical protein [Deltaproteobacteria bacterium]
MSRQKTRENTPRERDNRKNAEIKSTYIEKERAHMNHIKIASQTQADVHVFDKIDEFFNHFHVSTMLHRCGVRKRHGYSVRSLVKPVFSLPFLGKNFSRGIVINDDVSFGKDKDSGRRYRNAQRRTQGQGGLWLRQA